MKLPHFVVGALSIGLMVADAGAVSGQAYPNKPVRIVTAEIGGSADFTARLIAQGISGPLGQPVIVDNRPAGVIQGQIVAKAPPDGYTLLFTGSSVWLLPFMRDNIPFDPVRDFSPVTLATALPAILVVHPSVPVKSVKELIALAKAKPGELNYSSGPAGTASHLAGALFNAMAGVNIVRIAYKGGGPALNDVIGGRVQLMYFNAGAVMEHVKAGRLRALAVTTAQPSALVPDLSTVAATGLPGYESVTTQGLFAPAKTPAMIIKRLNQEIVQVLKLPDVKEKIFITGVEPVGSSPEQFAAAIKSDMARLGKVIKDSGIRSE